MKQDDEQVGHLLSRRQMVALFGATLLNVGRTEAKPAENCVVVPEQTEGPFFFDERRKQSDIRSGRPGKTVDLTLRVSRLRNGRCEPLAGAVVDIWQCDASGNYDDELLRGYQIAGERGEVRFLTIYPGWYSGRTVHIHFKVRAEDREFTSQLYFDDALTDLMAREAPYAGNTGRRVRNQNDGIFRRGGDQLTLHVTKAADPLAASFAIAMQF